MQIPVRDLTACCLDAEEKVTMWVKEEIIGNKQRLTDYINKENENCRYLPGVKLGKNLSASPDLNLVVQNSDLLIFVMPHQFIR